MADEFLGGMLGDEPVTPEAEAPVQEPEAALEPAPETVTEPTPEPEATHQPEPQQDRAGYVPIDAMLTEREKRQALERRLAEMEAQRQPQDVPDPFDDPQGYQAHLNTQLQAALFNERFATSEYLATEKFGEETVKSAADWAKSQVDRDPDFAARFAKERFPMMWIVQQHKRDALLSEVGDNVDDWFTREAAKRGYVAQSAPVAAAAPVAAIPQTAARPPAPPKSIASDAAPSVKVAPQDEKTGFLAAFR